MSDTSSAQPHAPDLSEAVWRRATASGPENNCVEVAGLPGGVAVRDSKDIGRTPLRFRAGRWADFRKALISGTL
ncbi:DUF397 domain-containing protein [Streptomyces alkaliphilus]|uniref:DUF397 domain-containing protein n=1 Tax=Streptomyces alkaliphilus TaxID=1472722 RepID=UPI00117C1282|nr:DUF397 domain-containing protein [Streptomyces alkaliphilus]MQS06213.1 DUF397 domain-containing protein [Streptomyces alkaliphilus]